MATLFARRCILNALLALVGLIPAAAQSPRQAHKAITPDLLAIATGAQRAWLSAPQGPCAGTLRFLVGPGLRVTATTSPSIAGALAQAAARNACSVEIDIQAGTYGEPLTITRDTTIRNATPADRPVLTGPLTCSNAILTLTGLILRDTPAPAALTLTGGITILQSIVIERAAERGIVLQGGVLKASTTEVRGTRSGASRQGVGIDLTYRGASSRAILQGLQLQDNIGWGILAAGQGTVVKASNVTIRGSVAALRAAAPPAGRRPKSLPDAVRITAGMRDAGAVRISDGAALYGKTLYIDRNEFAGMVIEQGGQANVQDSKFIGTRAISDSGGSALGGNNIVVKTGGLLELVNFEATDGALSGLVLDGGWVKGTNGTLTRNEFGLVILSPAAGWKRRDCFSNTRSFGNRSSDLDEGTVIPTSSGPGGSPQPCRGVSVPSI